MKENRKKLIWFVMAALVVLLMVPVITTPKVQAASLSTKNKKAHKVLKKKYNSLYSKYQDIEYKYFDVTGDGVHELLMQCYPTADGGSGRYLFIYQANKGKAKCILKGGDYGINYIKYYKKSKSLIYNTSGHGYERYVYFKFKNGKYKKIASKSRMSVNGGSEENGPWYYQDSSYNEISKSAFSKKTKNMKKGKAKKTDLSTWTYETNPNFSW